MIKIENTDVYGWEAAIRGMRNPMNSWDKSDSKWNCVNRTEDFFCTGECEECEIYGYEIGDNDLKLMKSLSKAGNDHGKFLRMINVTFDLTAPLYFFKEWDTYKVGTVANSCSTMHKIQAKEFTLADFSFEHLITVELDPWGDEYESPLGLLKRTIDKLNQYREYYLKSKDKKDWWQMIQLLPSSYNQKRTVQLNYQVLKSMYFARRNHKLDEWLDFCEWCESLPYFREVVIQDGNVENN